jgi:predicted nucleic acid-binding protein
VKAFFDTNVLVYAATSDPKKKQAAECLRGGGLASVQVLNEFVHVARRKLRHDWQQIAFALQRCARASTPRSISKNSARRSAGRRRG